MKRMLKQVAGGGLMALACFCGSASAALFDDEPAQPVEEAPVVFPPFPKDADLMSFYVGPTTPNKFYLDTKSLSIGKDGTVRYVVVVESPAGARTVTYESIRCKQRERRIYAVGESNGSWRKSRKSEWEGINDNSYNRQRASLADNYLCDGRTPQLTVEDIIRKLRSFSLFRQYE